MDLLNSSSSVGIFPLNDKTMDRLINILQLGGPCANTVCCGRLASIPSHICVVN